MSTATSNPSGTFSSNPLHSLLLLGLCLMFPSASGERLIWPTPSTAFDEGQPYEDFVQATASGRPESALFGCVRNGGRRFHEGLDIRPVQRRSRGEATDPVYAAAGGVVAYINPVAGNSGYGRYIVLVHEHVTPAFYTLYAHLRSIDDAIEEGEQVERGQTLGIMGRSAGGYVIPRSRAHLHFEAGLRLSDAFQNWYDTQGFGSDNLHGLYNGMNLVGWNPLDFLSWQRDFPDGTVQEYIEGLLVGAIIQVRTSRIPDFVRRYPSQLTRALPEEGPIGWRVEFSPWGLPLRWTPLTAGHPFAERSEGEVAIEAYHQGALDAYACRQLVDLADDGISLGSGGQRILRLLFDFN